jgi:tetratricopeptide (TPR) repeat protein
MKKFALLLFMVSLCFSLEAQIQTPAPSPSSTLEQKVGLTDVTVKYSRPAMKGRTIFGDLVPYGAIWRTGANQNTVITFSDDVTVKGKELKAGSYAIYTRPNEAVWEVFFYTTTDNWGNPQEWDASKVAATVKVETMDIPMPIESFTITIDDLHNNGATLGIMWENTYVGVDFVVPTVDKAMKSIQETMANKEDLQANDYFAAGSYYFSEGVNIEQAKEWVDKAVEMDGGKAYWMMRTQSLIYAKMGDKKAAIEAAKKSMAAAQAAGNQDYVKMNKDSLKEWAKM